MVIAVAILLAMPMFTVFASLSDQIGRKWIIMAGCALGSVAYMPIYKAIVERGQHRRRDPGGEAKYRHPGNAPWPPSTRTASR